MRSQKDGGGACCERGGSRRESGARGGLASRSSLLYWSEAGSGGHSRELHSTVKIDGVGWTFELSVKRIKVV